MKLYLLLLGLAGAVFAEQVRYDNYKVFRVTPTSDAHVNLLRNLEETERAYSFWTETRTVGVPVDIMVSPAMIPDFMEMINNENFEVKLFIENVQERIDIEKSVPKGRIFDWNNYYSLADLYQWLADTAAAHPEATVVTVGSTYEGRQIQGLKITYGGTGKKTFIIECGIHAREWIAPAVCTWITNQLLTSTDPIVMDIAQGYNWHIVPSANPDGYEYSRTTDRLWRKTRQPYGTCFGADPNRNWGFHWMDGGSSTDPCSETHAGSSAFSEPETASFSNYIAGVQSTETVVGYLGFHSYSQLILLPYGHTNVPVNNYNDLMSVGTAAATVLAGRYGTQYQVGNIVDVLYVASGGSMDWVKGTYDTPITYTYELRDTGANGFVLPPSQIIPCSEETFDSFLEIIRQFRLLGIA